MRSVYRPQKGVLGSGRNNHKIFYNYENTCTKTLQLQVSYTYSNNTLTAYRDFTENASNIFQKFMKNSVVTFFIRFSPKWHSFCVPLTFRKTTTFRNIFDNCRYAIKILLVNRSLIGENIRNEKFGTSKLRFYCFEVWTSHLVNKNVSHE